MKPAQPVESALAGFFAPRLQVGARVCVGLSGGRDSVVLLHAMRRVFPEIVLSAVHVHHGLSANADAWAAFCRALCADLSVALRVTEVTVPRGSGEGIEGAARRLRHAVFSAVDADWLALAHHRDDQAETVLLNLLRGAGLSGASGMREARPQGGGAVLVRPLLTLSGAVLADYARIHGLRWVDDESNADARFRRNFLRHAVLPSVEEGFPGSMAALARAAGHFAEAADLLDVLAAQDAAACQALSGRVRVADLHRLAPGRARNVLRYLWRAAGFRAPDASWIAEALRQLAAVDAQAEMCVRSVDGALHVYRGEVYVVPARQELPLEPRPWTGEDWLPWAGGRVRFVATTGQGVRRDMLNALTVLRPRQGGERLRPDAQRPRRSVRNLFQEGGVPPWERARLPYLWVGDALVWVGGLGCDVAFCCPPGEAGVLPVWESV